MDSTYKIRKNNVIYKAKTIIKEENDIVIYSRSFPSTNPILGVKIHLVPPDEDQESLSISAVNKMSNSDKPLYIINLINEAIGSYFLYGLCADYITNFENFLGDIKIGNINVSFINADKTVNPANLSFLLEDLIKLVGKVDKPTIHIFVSDMQNLKEVSGRMKSFFLKCNGEILDNN